MTGLRATYRVQFTADFTFEDARALVPYWRELGISHLYASPILAARTGSQHGYDAVDHDLINPELGGEAGFQRLVEALHAAGMGLILDIVPNHMGIGDGRNAAWIDLLEFGREGPRGLVFDVDWQRGPVLVPVLGETLGKTLAAGDLVPEVDAATPRLAVRYHAHVLPLRPRDTARVLTAAAERLDHAEFLGVARRWQALEAAPSPAAVDEHRAALRACLAEAPVRTAVEAAFADLMAEGSDAFAGARRLLDAQFWRLANWRTAQDEINYRRFFNISDLAAVRVELPEVFEAVHALPLSLVQAGAVQGLRVDHIDGLTDPAEYCRRLRARVGPDVSIHIEKILDRKETLRPWPIEGTTGYETLNLINGLFIDPQGYAALAEQAWRSGLLGGSVESRVTLAKRKLLSDSFVAELDKLTDLAKAVADCDLDTRDFSREAIRRAIAETIVRFPVYRTYLTASDCTAEDAEIVDRVADGVKSLVDPWRQSIVDFVRGLLLRLDAPPATSGLAIEFRARFQQLTAPVMAKGYEDTELYRHIVLVSVNEVGGRIAAPAVDAATFHREAERQAAAWPAALIPLATHDTKRGAGARARIDVLSECAEAWVRRVDHWGALNRGFKTERDGRLFPEAIDERLTYQTMLGSWPLTSARLVEYLAKAVREAKRRTSWENPDLFYEDALAAFASALIDSEAAAPFRADFERFLAPIEQAGRLNALAQTIIQCTFPGVPDIYWGAEFWDYAMVDPDNRRPVDWTRRAEALAGLGAPPPLAEDREGVGKLDILRRLLAFRRRNPRLMAKGSYRPLEIGGPAPWLDHWIAYMREGASEEPGEATALIVIVPVRGLAVLTGGVPAELALKLPDGYWGRDPARDIVSDRSVELPATPTLRALVGERGFAVLACGWSG